MILLTLRHVDGRRVLVEREGDFAVIRVQYPEGHADIHEVAPQADVLVRVIEDIRETHPAPEWREDEERG